MTSIFEYFSYTARVYDELTQSFICMQTVVVRHNVREEDGAKCLVGYLKDTQALLSIRSLNNH